ncbi:MAG TPA: amidohydrolase family protein [Caldilineaceae bacterium]|nr:amidohydrolase family protein [Caldilineaceae bacterium]
MTRLTPHPIIDCDLHNEVPSLQVLYPYLPAHWVDYCNESAFVGPDANDYPANAPTTARPGSKPPAGHPGSDLGLLREQALEAWNSEVGILNCAYRVASVHNQDLAAALATAVNHWQVDEWLDKEPRLRASIVVPSQNPERAAQEVERWGDHPGFVQVTLPVRSEAPYGNLRYDPIYQAAVRHDLAVGIHYGGAPGHPSTPSGWALTYWEEYAGMAQVFQSQLFSLIIEGAFDRFPALRVALIEGGWSWLPALCWRMDKEWKGLRHNTPWVRRLPSAYVREHVRLTWLPLDAPPTPGQLLQVIEQLESEELLLFATDYPHWHFDTPEEILPAHLPASLLPKLLAENARSFYRLA